MNDVALAVLFGKYYHRARVVVERNLGSFDPRLLTNLISFGNLLNKLSAGLPIVTSCDNWQSNKGRLIVR